jgi:hypothetical protein
MKKTYSWLMGLAVVVALAAPAFADTKIDDSQPIDIPTANCDLTGYKTAAFTNTAGSPIPDNGDLFLGPLSFPPENGTILDVVVGFTLTHTWVGDLIIDIGYDATCDGTVDAVSTIHCRPRGTAAQPAPCGTSATSFGASGDFVIANSYRWTDATPSVISDGVNPTPIASGCYRPTPVGGTPLSVFNGLPKNGCWYAVVGDYAGGDIGSVYRWEINLLNEVTPTVQSSWGSVKAIYR